MNNLNIRFKFQGLACCDPVMNYQLVRSIEDAKNLPNYNKYDVERIATVIYFREFVIYANVMRATQKRRAQVLLF